MYKLILHLEIKESDFLEYIFMITARNLRVFFVNMYTSLKVCSNNYDFLKFT